MKYCLLFDKISQLHVVSLKRIVLICSHGQLFDLYLERVAIQLFLLNLLIPRITIQLLDLEILKVVD